MSEDLIDKHIFLYGFNDFWYLSIEGQLKRLSGDIRTREQAEDHVVKQGGIVA